jgi:hypothetical protein
LKYILRSNILAGEIFCQRLGSIVGYRNRVARVVVTILVLLLVVLPLASLALLVQAAVPWTKYLGSLSLLNGVSDEPYVMDAWVIKDGATYKMWYTHSRTDMDIATMAGDLTTIISSPLISALANLDLAGLLGGMADIGDTQEKMDALWDFMIGTTTVVGYAESTDGVDWNVVNDEVLAGASDTLESVGFPCVINDGGTYKMWFTHSVTSLDKGGLQSILQDLDDPDLNVVRDALIDLMDSISTAIGYATSTDGIDWGIPQYNVFSGTGSGIWDSVATPCVINDSGTYKMWYTYADTSLTASDIDNILASMGYFTIDDLMGILDNTRTVIGYTESADGINWGSTSVVLAGSGGIWDSVAFPCVIKNGSTYEMFYGNATTDLTPASIEALINEIQALKPDILSLWDSLASGDWNAFLTDLDAFFGDPGAIPPVPGAFDPVLPYLANTGGVIGHAASSDGTSWDIQNPINLVGAGGSPWSSVGAPCVIYNSGVYEMWYVQGIEFLTAQNIASLLDGTILPLGYASYEVSIDLVSGWNFIGLPRTPASTAIGDVLAGIINDVRTVWTYDAATGLWTYYTTIQGAPQGGLTNMTEGKGYWIELINPATLIISGAEPFLPYDIDLVVGWNLISIPETPSPSAIEDVLSGIIANVRTVWTYDAATGLWTYYTTIQGAPQGGLTNMTEGKAYWIEMTAPDMLTIN